VPPEPLLERVPDFPKELARVIHRCLEKDPSDRFRTFEALVDCLKR